jgi:hypothetical protein
MIILCGPGTEKEAPALGRNNRGGRRADGSSLEYASGHRHATPRESMALARLI